ncbi:MAG: hypothetical protein AB7F32_06105, partial [Victivallaceae bacterium]
MNENTLTDISFELDQTDLFRQWQIDEQFADDVEEFGGLIERARVIGRPKGLWREFPLRTSGKDSVEIGGREFHSRLLTKMLKGKTRGWIFCITCGKESDALLDPADPLVSWRADELRMQMLHAARQAVENDLKTRCRIAKVISLAPGSGQTEQLWSITALRDLFALAGGDFTTRLGVELTPEYLMLPAKTVCGIFVESAHDFQSCMLCRKENCPSRRAAFEQAAWDMVNH